MRGLIVSCVAVCLTAVMVTQLVAKEPKADSKAADKPAALAVGDAAPNFRLQDQNGKQVSLADYKDQIVVLEWFNEECPFVVKHYKEGHMNELAEKYTDQKIVWLLVNSTSSKENASNLKIAESWKITRPILNDATGEVGHQYGAKTTPNMYIIGKDGKVAYMGAIDNKPTADTDDLKGATNYVAAALDEILADKPVSTPQSKPYGCSVKYAK